MYLINIFASIAIVTTIGALGYSFANQASKRFFNKTLKELADEMMKSKTTTEFITESRKVVIMGSIGILVSGLTYVIFAIVEIVTATTLASLGA
ncbi:MAG: hypothetical protein LBC17_04065 [Lactobacillaceae bacterium]|jgi:hypothetical protein|nr:hypothetical protein [Lactobacillaceae bacterium]